MLLFFHTLNSPSFITFFFLNKFKDHEIFVELAMTSLAVSHTYINLNLYQLPRRSCNKSFIKFEKRLKKKKEKAKSLSRCGLCSRDLYSPYLALISCVISRCCRTISSTTDGSAKVETSPSSSGLSAATFLNMRRMIFPDRVFGRPDTT